MRSVLCAAALLAMPAVAQARPASRGLVAEGGLGVTAMLGPGQADAKPGPTLNLRVGYDLWSWLSLGVQAAASSHEATVPPPPEGEWFQLYRGGADARLRIRGDRVGFFVEGDVGAAYISSNVLGKVGITDPGEVLSLALQAGGGLEYQIGNRHYAFGVAGDWWMTPQFDALTGVDVRAYLRYTAD